MCKLRCSLRDLNKDGIGTIAFHIRDCLFEISLFNELKTLGKNTGNIQSISSKI